MWTGRIQVDPAFYGRVVGKFSGRKRKKKNKNLHLILLPSTSPGVYEDPTVTDVFDD